MKNLIILALLILTGSGIAAQVAEYPVDSIVFSHHHRVFTGKNIICDLEDKSYLNESLDDRNIYSLIQCGDSIFAVGRFPQIFNRQVMCLDQVDDILSRYWYNNITIDCPNGETTVTNSFLNKNDCDSIVYTGLMPDMEELRIVKIIMNTNSLKPLSNDLKFGESLGDIISFLNLGGVKLNADAEIHIFIIYPEQRLDYPKIKVNMGPLITYTGTMELVITNNRLSKIFFPPKFLNK